MKAKTKNMCVETTVYEAIDGREFEYENECAEYEQELLKILDGYGRLIEVLHDQLHMTYEQIAELSRLTRDNLSALGF